MELNELTEIWAQFVYEDKMDPRVRPEIADSWRKCKAAGVNPVGGAGRRVDDAVFKSICAANQTLIDTALPIMQSVFEIVKKSHFLLVLTDSVGYVLKTMGDENVLLRTEDLRFAPGALWNSAQVGTNAISTALDYDIPIQTVGPEHYCRGHHGWTCSAAPIHGINGEVIGCINMSGDVSAAHDHTLGLVLAAVFGIEGHLRLLHNVEIMRAALEGSADGILLLNEDYRPIWMNSAAQHLLGLTLPELERRDFRELTPGVDWASLNWREGQRYFADDVRVEAGTGVLRCSAAISPSLDYGTRTLSVTLKKQSHLIKTVNKMSGNRARYTFEDIYTRDPDMKKTLSLARKYADYDGNILIQGESGTGKELMAQAIHNAGRRAGGPFVTINCASLPREALESELFGYEAGALAGKFSEGAPGRFELADKGTLFLDGVTEIPLEFQSKLLRAVETHSISRLGGGQDIKLDIRIIATTNRNLEQAVESGSFRRDLYYILNVLKLEIPPLRQRPGDIGHCAELFLQRLNRAKPELEKSASQEFMAGLLEHSWPGNVRELQNGIERAFYSCPGSVLTADCLNYVIDRPAERPGSGKREGEAGEIMTALTVCAGDVGAAAEKLGLSRATLYRRIKKYGISPKLLK